MSLFIEDLERMQCSDPNHDGDSDSEFVITSQCHPRCTVKVLYAHRTIGLFCGVCGTFVTSIQVASKRDAGDRIEVPSDVDRQTGDTYGELRS